MELGSIARVPVVWKQVKSRRRIRVFFVVVLVVLVVSVVVMVVVRHFVVICCVASIFWGFPWALGSGARVHGRRISNMRLIAPPFAVARAATTVTFARSHIT